MNMMQQRIVLKVEMSNSSKSRSKAMKIASGTPGVRAVSIQGQNDQLVVIGEEVDLAELIRDLRKKVGKTNIVTVQAAPPQPQQPQMQMQTQTQQGYNEMPQVRRCVCEIPNSGFCGFCRAVNSQSQQMMINSPYQQPLFYPPCRDEYDGCNIM